MSMLACASMRCVAQAPGEEVIYRIELTDVQDQAAAKLVVHALMEERGVSSCVFIQECACFKLAVHHALDHAALAAMIQRAGHSLAGAVHGSDGSLLTSGAPTTR